MGSVNLHAHIAHIDGAMHELHALQARTQAPANLAHQYVGTIVDNTVGLLTAPANALDRGGRFVQFTEVPNWVSLMQAVHRSFFSSVHSATELALAEVCRERGANVSSRLKQATEGPLGHIEEIAGDDPTVRRALKDLRALMRANRPGFDDFLESALTTSSLPEQLRKHWRKFFKALSVIRNKASHAHPELTDSERARLRDGGLGHMIDGSGGLVMNTRMYLPVATAVLDFFDLLYANANGSI